MKFLFAIYLFFHIYNIFAETYARWKGNIQNIFPEFKETVEDVKRVLEVEKEKYYEMKRRSEEIVKKIIKKEITTEILIELYDSHGINPDIVKEAALKLGKKIIVPPLKLFQVWLQYFLLPPYVAVLHRGTPPLLLPLFFSCLFSFL